MDSSAMYVAAQIISLHSANRGEDDRLANKLHAKVTTLPGEARASIVDATPATLPMGTTARAPAIAHPTAQSMAHSPAI